MGTFSYIRDKENKNIRPELIPNFEYKWSTRLINNSQFVHALGITFFKTGFIKRTSRQSTYADVSVFQLYKKSTSSYAFGSSGPSIRALRPTLSGTVAEIRSGGEHTSLYILQETEQTPEKPSVHVIYR